MQIGVIGVIAGRAGAQEASCPEDFPERFEGGDGRGTSRKYPRLFSLLISVFPVGKTNLGED